MVSKTSLVIRDGQIYTVDKLGSWTQALAASGDKIVFVGSNKGVEKYIGSHTKGVEARAQRSLSLRQILTKYACTKSLFCS